MRTYSPPDPAQVEGPDLSHFSWLCGSAALWELHYDPSWINRLDCEAV